MDLHKLKYFCAVADASSLRQASETLRLSPGAVSKSIKHLENEFGVELFAHSGNKLAMTEAGRILYKRSRKLLLDYEELSRTLTANSVKDRKLLRLGTYCTFTTYLLDAVLGAGFDNLELRQSRIAPNDLEEAVLNHSVDIGLTYIPFVKKGLDFLPITEFEMQAFVLQGKFADLSFENIPFVASTAEVSGSTQDVQTIDGWAHKQLPRKVIYRVSGMDAALAIARQGLAAVYCPSFTVALHNKSVNPDSQLVPLTIPGLNLKTTYTVYMVKRIADQEDAVLKKLSTSIRKLCRKTSVPAES